MNIVEDTIKTNVTTTAGAKWNARRQCEDRSQQAVEDNPQFFNNPAHRVRVKQVRDALYARFGGGGKRVTMHENARQNRGNPFTSLKLENPYFGIEARRNKKVYDATLSEIGKSGRIEIKNVNGYLVRIY